VLKLHSGVCTSLPATFEHISLLLLLLLLLLLSVHSLSPHLQPAFPPELGDDLGQQLINSWGFIACMADLFG
jgi:hypothetical protein